MTLQKPRFQDNQDLELFLDTMEKEKALLIAMTSNTCNFMGRHFTQINGATIGGPDSASVNDIYGAAFIGSKIELNIINEDERWKRYRGDSF